MVFKKESQAGIITTFENHVLKYCVLFKQFLSELEKIFQSKIIQKRMCQLTA